MNPNETASFNLSIVRVSIHFTYYFAQLLSNTFVQKTYQNIVNLYPYRDFIKSKVTNRRNNFQPLKNNEMPIKTPRFTSQNFFHLLIIIKNKQNRMITRVMDLEAISGTPERTKSPIASMFKAHLVRNFTAIVYSLELLSFFTNIFPPSLSFRERLLQCFIRLSIFPHCVSQTPKRKNSLVLLVTMLP